MRKIETIALLGTILGIGLATQVLAQQPKTPSKEELVFFEQKVRPLLIEK